MNGIITNQQPQINITNTITSPTDKTVDLERTQNLQQEYQILPCKCLILSTYTICEILDFPTEMMDQSHNQTATTGENPSGFKEQQHPTKGYWSTLAQTQGQP